LRVFAHGGALRGHRTLMPLCSLSGLGRAEKCEQCANFPLRFRA